MDEHIIKSSSYIKEETPDETNKKQTFRDLFKEATQPDNIGKTIEEVALPDDTSLAAIVRDGRVFNPKAHDVFAAGDELIFVASNVAEATLKACFISN